PLDQATTAYQTILNPESGSLAVLLQYDPAPTTFQPQRRVAIQAGTPARSSAELRVGLIGSGNLARWAHLPNLKKAPNVTLRAVHSASGARGRTYAERFGAAYCCSDVREILDDPEIDAVLIVSRNQHHASQALDALRAGKHVFLEKPMALTVE